MCEILCADTVETTTYYAWVISATQHACQAKDISKYNLFQHNCLQRSVNVRSFLFFQSFMNTIWKVVPDELVMLHIYMEVS